MRLEGQSQPLPKATPPATKRWEYCAITGEISRKKDFSTYVVDAVIRYFPGREEKVEGPDEEEAVANAMAKLGDEGWELVAVNERVSFSVSSGSGNSNSSRIYYFKRQK
jgi:hypothetical protein